MAEVNLDIEPWRLCGVPDDAVGRDRGYVEVDSTLFETQADRAVVTVPVTNYSPADTDVASYLAAVDVAFKRRCAMVQARPNAPVIITTGTPFGWGPWVLTGTTGLFTVGQSGGVQFIQASVTFEVFVQVRVTGYLFGSSTTATRTDTTIWHALAASPGVFNPVTRARAGVNHESTVAGVTGSGAQALLALGAGDRLAVSTQRVSGVSNVRLPVEEIGLYVRGRSA